MSRALKFLISFAILLPAMGADFSAWKYRKRVPLTPSEDLGVVKLDREIYGAIGNQFASLRVVRDGEEVPYVFDTPAPAQNPSISAATILNETVTPGVGLQFTLHLPSRMKHNKVILGMVRKNFRSRVRVETSEDGIDWAIARDEAGIFNFFEDGREFGSTVVEFPVSTQPYIRVTVFGWAKIGSITSAAVDYEDTPVAAFEELAVVTANIWQDAAAKSTILQMDLGVMGLPVSRIVLQTESLQFQRAVGIEASDDGAQWSYLGSGTIARLPGRGFTQESLVLPVSGEHRYYRLSIHNRDDQPIQIGRVRMEGLAHQLKFLAAAKGSYWLYYGNPAAGMMPEYDLRLILETQNPKEHLWALEKAEENPEYRAPGLPRKPWSEQHPAILYTVLGGAVLALGIATFRFATRLRT